MIVVSVDTVVSQARDLSLKDEDKEELRKRAMSVILDESRQRGRHQGHREGFPLTSSAIVIR